jgi:hypothetical protein
MSADSLRSAQLALSMGSWPAEARPQWCRRVVVPIGCHYVSTSFPHETRVYFALPGRTSPRLFYEPGSVRNQISVSFLRASPAVDNYMSWTRPSQINSQSKNILIVSDGLGKREIHKQASKQSGQLAIERTNQGIIEDTSDSTNLSRIF